MSKEKLLSIFTLPILWLVYFLFEAFTGRVDNITVVLWNIVLIFLFALTGYLFYRLKEKYKKFSPKCLLLLGAILLILDQGIKIIIKFFFFDKDVILIKNFLSFSPIINTDGSWLNARYNANISFSLLIILNIIAILFFIELYRYLTIKLYNNFWFDFCFIFILCGAICSLIDKLFYGGSLDFIGIGNLFIADFKDIYIDLGILFFVLFLYSDNTLMEDDNSSLKDDIVHLKNFFVFIKKDIVSIFKK